MHIKTNFIIQLYLVITPLSYSDIISFTIPDVILGPASCIIPGVTMAESVCSSAFNENNNSSEFPSLVHNSSEISKDDSASKPSLSPQMEVELAYLLTLLNHYVNLLLLAKLKI